MRKKNLLFGILFYFLKAGYSLYAQDVGLIINEVKFGTDSDTITKRKEFIELLVVGCPGKGTYPGNNPDTTGPDPETVDIRGWIIDDDNGEFSASGSPSITQGHIRFANHPNWQKIPVGSLILIYNSAAYRDPLTNIPNFPISDDPTDIGGDKIYVLGIDAKDAANASYMEFCPDFPTATDPNYNPLICMYKPALLDSWRYLDFRSAGDGVQIRKDSSANFFHGISYGLAADPVNGGTLLTRPNSSRSIHFVNSNGANADIAFANPGSGARNDNYRTESAYAVTTNAGTPAKSNNTNNGAYRNQFISTFAGNDDFVCGFNYIMQARGVRAIWDPTKMWDLAYPGATSGVWSVDSKPDPAANISFGDFTANNSSVTVDKSGIYVFRWTQIPSDNICIDADIVSITFIDNPKANAGADTVVCGNTINLNAVDGVLGEWEFIPRRDSLGNPIQSGPTNTNFDPNDPKTSVTVAAEGVYTFRWKVGKAGVQDCFDFDDVKVQFAFNKFDFSAGADQNICGFSSRFAGKGPGIWRLLDTSPGGLPNPTIQDDTDPKSQVSVTQTGRYRFEWIVGKGQVCEDRDTVVLRFTQKPVANAGKDSTLCGLTYTLAANAPQSQTLGQWTQLSGPGTLTFANNSLQNTKVTANKEGKYTLRWKISGTDTTTLCDASDDVMIDFVDYPKPFAGRDTVVCGLSFNFRADPPADTLTKGLWSAVITPPNPGTANFGNPTANNSGVTVSAFGSYRFIWTLTRKKDGVSCPVSDTVKVTFVDLPGSGLVSIAGKDTTVCGFEVNLNAQLPTGTPPISGAWIFASAVSPSGATVTFDNPTSPTTRVSVNMPNQIEGQYVFLWTLSQQQSGPVCVNLDTVKVTFVAYPKPNAGKDSTICSAGLNYQLKGNSAPGGGKWRLLNGPGTANFSNDTLANSQVTVSMEGIYQFEWLLKSGPGGICTRTDTVALTFVTPPVPVASPDTAGICDKSISINANLPPNTTGIWAKLSGPGTATFGNATSANTTVSVNQIGNYQFTWTLTKTFNGKQVCPVSDTIHVGFINAPIPNAGPDVPDYCFNDSPSAVLAASPSSGPTGNGIWRTLSSGASFANATLPNTTVTVNAPGTYQLVWTVEPGTTCEREDTVTLTFTSPLNAGVATLPDSICGLSATLRATDGFPVGQWSAVPPAGVVFSDPTKPLTQVAVPATGSYTFTWKEGRGTCLSTSSTNPAYFSQPLDNPKLEPSPQVIIFKGKSTVLTASGGAAYFWSPTTALSDPRSPTPTVNPTENTTYSVRIKSGYCDTVLSVTVKVIIELQIPNVFTPNNDGVFDTWNIQALAAFNDASVEVFDRWGDRVYESKGYSKPWDGTNKNNGTPVPTSTYYYVIKLNNDQPPYTGTVVVTR